MLVVRIDESQDRLTREPSLEVVETAVNPTDKIHVWHEPTLLPATGF